MSKVFIEEDSLTAIGDAIRSKTGESSLLKVTEMPNKINSISGGSEADMSAVLGVDYNKLQYICGDSVTRMPNMIPWANNGSAKLPLQPACGNGITNMSSVYEDGWMLRGVPVFGNSVQNATNAYKNCTNLSPYNIIIPNSVQRLNFALYSVGSNYSDFSVGEAIMNMTNVKSAQYLFAVNCKCKNITVYGTPYNLGANPRAQCNNLSFFVGGGAAHNIYCLNFDTYNAFRYNIALTTDEYSASSVSHGSYSYVNIPILTNNTIIYKNYKYNMYTTGRDSQVYYVLPV